MNGRELISLTAVGDGTYRTGEILVTVGPQGEGMVCFVSTLIFSIHCLLQK